MVVVNVKSPPRGIVTNCTFTPLVTKHYLVLVPTYTIILSNVLEEIGFWVCFVISPSPRVHTSYQPNVKLGMTNRYTSNWFVASKSTTSTTFQWSSITPSGTFCWHF